MNGLLIFFIFNCSTVFFVWLFLCIVSLLLILLFVFLFHFSFCYWQFARVVVQYLFAICLLGKKSCWCFVILKKLGQVAGFPVSMDDLLFYQHFPIFSRNPFQITLAPSPYRASLGTSLFIGCLGLLITLFTPFPS